MDVVAELNKYNVSRETICKLQKFAELLSAWNNKMNLVSKKSLDDVWERHILDSVQLIKYIPVDTKILLDIGSGAGFPGIVLAILLQEKYPSAKVILVESITKKTMYLKDICHQLALSSVEILNQRIENTVFKKVDVITARAVASLNVLCGYISKISNKNTTILLLKGKSYVQEELEAAPHWQYSSKIHPNLYSADGVVMEIKNVRKKK